MCNWGTYVEVLAWHSADSTHDGIEQLAPTKVDACIAPIVSALNLASIRTASSCCGHGKGPGSILLQDGRELVVHPEWVSTGRAALEAVPE